MHDQSWRDPDDTSKLHIEVAQMCIVPTLATLLSLFHPAPMDSWGIIDNQLTEEETTWAWYTDGSAQYTSTT